MNVTPKRWFDESLRMLASDPRTTGVWFECEVTSPPSSRGRTAYLHIPPSMIADMLLALRAEAIEQRR